MATAAGDIRVDTPRVRSRARVFARRNVTLVAGVFAFLLLGLSAVAAPLTPRVAAQRANDRGLQLYRERRYDEAEAAFTEALKLQPRFALAANNLGFVYFKRGKPVEAARWFEQAIDMDGSRALASSPRAAERR